MGKTSRALCPHIGYDEDQGIKLRYNYSYDFSDHNTLDADIKYYSKIGWRPMFTDTQDERNYYVRYMEGFDEDDNNNWIRKMHDIKVGYKPHRFPIPCPFRILPTQAMGSGRITESRAGTRNMPSS